jgi:hypothetical protein
VQTRPYLNVALRSKFGSSFVRQSNGQYRVLSKSNLTLWNGITVYAYRYVSRIRLCLFVESYLFTHAGFHFINTFATDIFFIYNCISEKGVGGNFKCC